MWLAATEVCGLSLEGEVAAARHQVGERQLVAPWCPVPPRRPPPRHRWNPAETHHPAASPEQHHHYHRRLTAADPGSSLLHRHCPQAAVATMVEPHSVEVFVVVGVVVEVVVAVV